MSVVHTHMIIKGVPKKRPCYVSDKKYLSKRVFKLYLETKKQYFWGGKFWIESYFVESIGNANGETISKYVQNQLVELGSKKKNAKQFGFILKLSPSRLKFFYS